MFTVLGLLLAALLAPFGPLVLRRWALRHSRLDPVAAWFGFCIRLQWLTLAAFAVAILAGLFRNEMRPWFEQTFPGPWATPLRYEAALLPLGLMHATAALVAHGLSRQLRGVETPRRVAVELALLGAAMILVPLPLVAAGFAAMDAWGVEAGLAVVLAAVVLLLALAVRAQKLQGITLHSISTGDLRDRAFALAERARVRLDQVFALPLSKWKHANAFATEGRQVLVTDYLLDHLDRDEVDAVLAHEIAHLAGKDPDRQTRLLGALILVSLLLTIYSAPPFVTLAWILAAVLAWLAYSRQCEYGADRRAQSLGAVPHAAITGLAKLNHLGSVPIDYPRFVEWWLTHPSTARRARAIGAGSGLAPAEVERLLALPVAPVVRRYEAPVLPTERQSFTTPFKRSVLVRVTMIAILIGAAASLAFVNLARALEITGWLRLVSWPVSAVLVAGAMLAAYDYLATARFRAVARAAADRAAAEAGVRAAEGLAVGFAPHATPHLYEGFSVWDVGRVDFSGERMDYRGEQLRFSLARADVLDVQLAAGVPGWIATARVLVRWRQSDGRDAVFALSPSVAPRLSKVRAEARVLYSRIRDWWSAPETAGATAGPRLGSPPTAAVTGQLPGSDITSQSLFSLATLYAIEIALLGFVARIPLGFSSEPGVIDAFLSALLGHFILFVPLLRARSEAGGPTAKASESDVSRAA